MDIIDPADPLGQLPRDSYHHLILTLRDALPSAGGDPRAERRRDHAAIAQIGGLCPANAAEAALAAQFVAANAQAFDCLRRADAAGPDAERANRSAARMARLAQDAVRLLLRLQTARARREADETATSQAAWTEHCATSWMIDGLGLAAESDQKPAHNPTNSNTETDPGPDQAEAAGTSADQSGGVHQEPMHHLGIHNLETDMGLTPSNDGDQPTVHSQPLPADDGRPAASSPAPRPPQTRDDGKAAVPLALVWAAADGRPTASPAASPGHHAGPRADERGTETHL
jgi:hypothetical protein